MLELRNNARRSKTLRALFIAQFLLSLVVAGLFISTIEFINDNPEKHPELETKYLILVGLTGFAMLLLFLVALWTIIGFIRWFRRAYSNLHQFRQYSPLFALNWATISWFIPGINFIRPYQLMNEIWHKTQIISRTEITIQKTNLISIWWCVFLCSLTLNLYAFYTQFDITSAQELLHSLRCSFLAMAINASASLLIFLILKKLATFEKRLFDKYHTRDIADHLIE